MVRGSATIVTTTVKFSRSLHQAHIRNYIAPSRNLVAASYYSTTNKQIKLRLGQASFSHSVSHIGIPWKQNLSRCSSPAYSDSGVFGGIVQEDNHAGITSDVPLEDVLTYLLSRKTQHPSVIDGEGSAVATSAPLEIDEWISLRSKTIASFTDRTKLSTWNSGEHELAATAVIDELIQEMEDEGVLTDNQMELLEEIFASLPQDLKLQSEIFTPKQLLESLREALSVSREAKATVADHSADNEGAPTAYERATVEGSMALAATAVAQMKCDAHTHHFTDRSDVLALKTMVGKLAPHHRVQYLLPLGGYDTTAYARDVARFLPATNTFSDLVLDAETSGHIMGGVSRVPLATARALVDAWAHVPPVTRLELPGAAQLVQECHERIMQTELLEILPGIAFEQDWRISNLDWQGSDLREDVSSVLKRASFAGDVKLSEDGLIESDDDRTRMQKVWNTLPVDLRSTIPTPDELVVVVKNVFAREAMDKSPHAAAEDAIDEWIDMYGNDHAVPLAKAHAFFKHGTPLFTEKERLQETYYRYPDPERTHTPVKISQKGSISPDGTVVKKSRSDNVSHNTYKSLSSSTALFTNGAEYHRALIWMERLHDELAAHAPAHTPTGGAGDDTVVDLSGDAEPDSAPDATDAAADVDANESDAEPGLLSVLAAGPPADEKEAELSSTTEKRAGKGNDDIVLWQQKDEMSQLVGSFLTIAEYRSLTDTLNTLWYHEHSAVVRDRIKPFLRHGEERVVVVSPQRVDVYGRVRTLGRRKKSAAQVRMQPGTGRISINGQDIAEYFKRDIDRYDVIAPLVLTKTLDSYDVSCKVAGGGNTGQAGACRHGIARALVEVVPETRPTLKTAMFLRRDPRMVERKKPGQKKARKKFQWVKR